MSGAATAAVEADQNDDVCANCGISQVDEIKLEDCDGCDLVKYCGDKCKGEHRDQHKEECKKRAKKLHDNDLFTQPDETHLGECPICFLPMPLDPEKSMFHSCCSNLICMGCIVAQMRINKDDSEKATRCPFCREPAPDNDVDKRSRLMERVKANDPAAMAQFGTERYDDGDYGGAFGYFTNAAELGDFDAHYQLGCMYHKGEGVEEDEEKKVYHYEKAAIGGHPYARYNLGGLEKGNGNIERAAKHFIISANLGFDKAMKRLLPAYKDGHITKEEYEATLRTHQAAVDATKSSERDFADKSLRDFKNSKTGYLLDT